jgi:hypothetical protein
MQTKGSRETNSVLLAGETDAKLFADGQAWVEMEPQVSEICEDVTCPTVKIASQNVEI